MTYLILGLVIFLGAHSVRIYAEDWRARTIARMGPNGWKAVYSLVSIAGFVSNTIEAVLVTSVPVGYPGLGRTVKLTWPSPRPVSSFGGRKPS